MQYLYPAVCGLAALSAMLACVLAGLWASRPRPSIRVEVQPEDDWGWGWLSGSNQSHFGDN